jgi:hypothetical protein
MAGVKFPNTRRDTGKKGNATSITASQRSTCNVVVYRWSDPNMSKLALLDAKADAALKGTNPTNGNLKEQAIPIVIKNDVVRCSITKNKTGSSGQFSITLKRGKEVKNGVVQNKDINYLELINPGDWVMIYMKKSGTIKTGSTAFDSGLKMVGIIDNVRYVETDDEATGRPRLEYVITGQDFGKIFDMDIFFNPLLAPIASQLLGAKFNVDAAKTLSELDRADASRALSPDLVVKKLASFYLGGNKTLDSLNTTNEAWYVPKSLALNFKPDFKNRSAVSAIDIVDMDRIGLHKFRANKFLRADPLPGGTFFKALPSQGTVWSVLEFVNNKVANEMYTELVRGSDGLLRPALIMRQIPYSNKKSHETNAFTQAANFGKSTGDSASDSDKTYLIDLPQVKVNSSQIKQKNVGKSDFERINHLLVVPKSDVVQNMDELYQSVVNVPSIQRYGLKTFQAQTGYIFGQKFGSPTKACRFFLDLLIDWFFLAHQFYNGTIVIDGLDENIEVGSNLFIEDIGQLYHIEAYNHVYEVNTEGDTVYSTSLTVSRGQVLKGANAQFIGPSNATKEPTTITSSVLEGIR